MLKITVPVVFAIPNIAPLLCEYSNIAINEVKNSGNELPIAFMVAPRVPSGIFFPKKSEAV